jgi:hypothetical protein
MKLKLSHICVLSILGSTLAACASGPKLARVEVPTVAPTLGRVYFYRTMLLGSTIPLPINVNGVKVGTCKASGVFFTDLAPGTYQATVGVEAQRERTFSLAAGEEKYLRCFISMEQFVARGNLQVVAPEEAKEEMRDLAYTGKTRRE